MTYRTRVACVYLLGFFIDLINMFIANVAYPDIARYFDTPVSLLAWVSNGYILGLTLIIPLSGWLVKRVGSKRLFMLSLLIFMLGSGGAGSASSMAQLIGWRLVQGLGGGLLIPLGQTLTYALYRSHERARLSAAIMLVGLLAPALSPALGGIIVDNVSWRWVFFASLPLAIVALILAGYWLKADTPTRPAEPLDLSGLLTSCGALTLILLGLTRMGEAHQEVSGGLMLLWALAAFVAISLTGKQFNRWGPRPLFITGCVMQGMGIALLTQISTSGDIVTSVAAFTLMGFGSSLCSSTAQSCAFIQIKDTQLADASALWNINRQLSFCFGVTLLSLLLNLLLGQAGIASQQAYRLCFALAAGSVVIPILLCLRIANRNVIFTLNQEKP